jgi:hypothetical protein
MREHEIDIVVIQETNKTSGMNLLNRGKLHGLKLVWAIRSNVHGLVKYIRNTLAERFDPTPIFVGALREKPHYFSIVLIIDTPKSIFFFIFFNVNSDNYK